MMFTFESIGDEIVNLSAKPKMGEVPPKQDKDKKRNVCVCVCVYLGHFAVQQKLAQNCKSTAIFKM